MIPCDHHADIARSHFSVHKCSKSSLWEFPNKYMSFMLSVVKQNSWSKMKSQQLPSFFKGVIFQDRTWERGDHLTTAQTRPLRRVRTLTLSPDGLLGKQRAPGGFPVLAVASICSASLCTSEEECQFLLCRTILSWFSTSYRPSWKQQLDLVLQLWEPFLKLAT